MFMNSFEQFNILAYGENTFFVLQPQWASLHCPVQIWCSVSNRIFLKCSWHIIVLLPTQMNIGIFHRHAPTVSSVGCAVFIFAVLCRIHAGQEWYNFKKSEFKRD